jgi:cell wall-associated NlpC family hydrolase
MDGERMRAYEARLRRGSVAAGLAIVLTVAFGQAASAHSTSAKASVTTCAVIAAGSTGPAVKTLQKAVGASADGDFGPATQKSVRKWQKTHSLPVTGIVDAATWAALPAAVGQRACGQHVTGSGVAVTCTALSSGASGLAVAVLQSAMGTTVDGQFGPATKQAVEQVQRDSELKITGVTNAHTWKAVHRWGTPVCSTHKTVGPRPPADAKAQAKVRAQVQHLVSELEAKPGTTKNQVALQAMAFAKKQIGKPYVWGGTGPKGYDCSGLQMTSYRHAGLTIPRVSAAQYIGAGTPKPLNKAKQGDLLFFASDVTKPSTIYHVSMYVGGGNMLEAPHTGANVRIVPLWTSDLLPIVVRPVAGLELPMKPGATGWSVSQLQQALNRHGAALSVDGGYGPTTKNAVVAWQKDHKLPTSGVVRLKTWLSFG